MCLVYLSIKQRRFKKAHAYCKEIRTILEKRSDPILSKFLQLFEGSINIYSNENIDDGVQNLKDLLQSLPKKGFERIIGFAMETIAFADLLLGNFSSAIKDFTEVETFYRTVGNIQATLHSKIHHSYAMIATGALSAAKKMIDDTILESKVHAYDYGIYLGTILLSDLYLKIGQLELASFELALILQLGSTLGNDEARAFTLLKKGQVNFMYGRYGRAEKNLLNALELISPTDSKSLKTTILHWLILTEHKLGKPYEEHFKMFVVHAETLSDHPPTQLSSCILYHTLGKLNVFENPLFLQLLERPEIGITEKLDALFLLVDVQLDQMRKSCHLSSQNLFQMSDIFETLNEFAVQERSIFHKILFLLLKAKFHAVEQNNELLEPTLQMAEGFIEEYGLNHFKPSVWKIRQIVEKNKGISNFQNLLFEDTGFADDFLQVYDFERNDRPSLIAFILTRDGGLELLNIPLQRQDQPQLFISGLLYGIKLLSYFWKENQTKYLNVGVFTVFFHYLDGLEFWLIAKGIDDPELVNSKFLQTVEEMSDRNLFQKNNIDPVVEHQIRGLFSDLKSILSA